MGLDMYLERMPRYKNATAKDINILESYFDWRNQKENPNSNAKNYTLKEWCGVEYADVPKRDIRKFYEPFFTTRYSQWDTKKQYGFGRIMDQIGYWRKANQIHNWFVEHVQDGEDDCCYHHEVTKEILEELLDTCEKVLANCELVDGKINNGYKFENGKTIPIMKDGKYVKDPSVAMELLSTTSGFFFGGTDYDEYYVNDIKDTIDIITNALETTNFEKEMIYYVSSW